MPPDKFTFKYLDLRKEYVYLRLRALEDYSERDRGKNLLVLREEVKSLKNEIYILKQDVLRYNASVKAVNDRHSTEEFALYEAILRKLMGKYMLEPEPVVNKVHPSNDNTRTLPLEPIPLPLEQFSLFVWNGDITKWNLWFSLFENTIDKNPSLTNAQKFLYLKKNLSDEPLAICNQLEITDANYREAIALLKNRYQNNWRLGAHYLSQILDFNKNNQSSDLNKYIITVRSSIAALKNLPDINDLADFTFFHILYQNLDVKMQKDFDMMHPCESGIPKVEELLYFVQFSPTNKELKSDSNYLSKERKL